MGDNFLLHRLACALQTVNTVSFKDVLVGGVEVCQAEDGAIMEETSFKTGDFVA